MMLATVLTLVLLTSVQSSDATEELVRLEEVWNTAHLEGNAATLEGLWADEFTVTVPGMAVMARADAIGVARSNRIQFLKYETSELVIRVFDQAAVVQGRMRRSRMRGEQAVEDDWQFTKVYVKQGEAWKVVAFHASERPH